jgi:iron complex outermembrane receptor protein
MIRLIRSWLAPFIVFTLPSPAVPQQGDPVIEALTVLQSVEFRLKNAKTEAGREIGETAAELRAIYSQLVERQRHAGMNAPPERPSREGLLGYVTAFRARLEDQERQRPGSAFDLGRVEVNVTGEYVQTITASTLDEAVYRERNAQVLPDALNLTPGLHLQRIGPRNERGVFVRGFDIRQVPLYIDGIPLYVPYDGYVDMDRFLTYDFSEIQVAKGFTSPLYGPNAAGGAINLISKAPVRPHQFDLGSGYASGDQVHGFANAGARWKRFWLQGGFSWLSSDTFPLSGKFQPVPLQPSKTRLNAYQTDYKTRLRAAWTPNDADQYTFTYAIQRGEKGNPPYAGSDPAVRARFWQWPQWDKESFYFIANKGAGTGNYLRARLFYDKFDNLLKAFDDARYATQTRPSSFTSPYDDDTYGAILEVGSRKLRRHAVKGAFYYKDDTHREGNLGEPQRSFRDQSFSLGLEDTVSIAERTSAVFGVSGDHIRVRNAEDFQQDRVLPFPQNDLWAFNAQAGVFHALTEAGKLRFTFARKTRLPTMKDRYSYRLGQAIPNPGLREERSNNWEVGYSHLLGRGTVIETAAFLSQISNSTERFYIQPNLFQLRNLGQSCHLGGEFSVRSNPARHLLLIANYTYLSRRNTTNPALLLVGTPRHKVYITSTYELLGRLRLMADWLYQASRFYQNDAGTFGRSAPYATLGLGGILELTRSIDLHVGVANVLDRSNFLVEGYPEAGRNAYVNLRLRF